jgi:chondroitin AC lyase
MKCGVSVDTLDVLRPVFDRSKLGMTGQNLADAAMIHLWKGLYYNDKQTVREAIDAFLSVVKISGVGKEGIQADFSFHQHGPQQQFGNYGLGFFENSVTFMKMLSGSSCTMPEGEKQLLYDYFFRGLRWTLYKKQMDYLACGRQITGKAPYDKYEKTRENAWYFDDTKQAKTRVKEFFRNDSALEGSNYFFRSDYLVHRRRNFYFSFSFHQ